MESRVAVLTAVLAILLVIALTLLGQAAYLRARLDALAPRSDVDVGVAASGGTPALKAYSLKVNVAATLALKRVPAIVTAARQLGTCGSSPATVQIDALRFPAAWLVLRAGSAGAGARALLYDVTNGFTTYLVLLRDTYVIAASPGGPAEAHARASAAAFIADDDVLVAVRSVADINATLTAPGDCRLMLQHAPIMRDDNDSDSLLIALLLHAVNQGVAHPYLLQPWGYASGVAGGTFTITGHVPKAPSDSA